MYKGSISFSTPMCYALSFLFLFTIGGLTGVFLGTLSVDVHLHDTYFVVAHFHYVMFGGTIIGFLAGIFYWWPKITGKMYNENGGRIGCFLIFIGFNLTFLPQFVMGSLGMPRRYATYLPQYMPYHVMSTIGAYIQFIGFATAAVVLLHSLSKGRRAARNPWGAATLEWTCTSPPPHDNFKSAPTVGDPYEHRNLKWDEAQQGYVKDESMPLYPHH
jgi:cytochrome c oxidase subunit 1